MDRRSQQHGQHRGQHRGSRQAAGCSAAVAIDAETGLHAVLQWTRRRRREKATAITMASTSTRWHAS